VQQKIKPKDSDETFNSPRLKFAVLGERFSLNPAGIHALFPPSGSLGRHTDCLPHISINRSTFPWERSAYGNEDYEPWLALLLFDEEEIKAGDVVQQIITLDKRTTKKVELPDGTEKKIKFPRIDLETGQKGEDKVTVIDIKKSLLQKIIPTGEELKLLTHVRRRVNGDESAPETELAVVVGNRLPREGADSTVHLVSVENRYNNNNNNNNNNNKLFNYQSAKDNDYIRLVSLKKWSFACLPEDGKNFEELVENISTGTLRLPELNSVSAENYLKMGYVPLPHKLRQCDTTCSWYHGPLAPQDVKAKFETDDDLPDFGDALIRYHKDIGMFDNSYAAAFEIGRALALEDNLFSAALYQWKHNYNEQVYLKLQKADIDKNPDKLLGAVSSSDDSQENTLETKIKTWFKELALLNDIPFNYLIPDEKMLPPESIRFFKLDQHWIECMLYGAFTIGGYIRTESGPRISKFRELTENIFDNTENIFDKAGFIVRSELVSDYPDLMVDAYSAKVDGSNILTKDQIAAKLTNIRMERIGSDVLFCLFEGDVRTAELYLKPEGLHFGLDEEEENGLMKRKKELRTEYVFNSVNNHLPDNIPVTRQLNAIKKKVAAKKIFYIKGSDSPQADGGKFEFPVNFKPVDSDKRLLDIKQISNSINNIVKQMAMEMTGKSESKLPQVVKTETSAHFGMYMLEGSNKGRFVVGR
jgi:hypothetical protein